MKFKIFQAHAVRIRKVRGGADAKQDFMRVLIFVVEVVGVTGYDQRNVGLVMELHQLLVNSVLDVPMSR